MPGATVMDFCLKQTLMKRLKDSIYNLYLLLRFLIGSKKEKRYFTGKEKKLICQFVDQLLWLTKNRHFNANYFAFGLNQADKNLNDFIGKDEFNLIKNKAEKILRSAHDVEDLHYEVLTKDKFVLYAYLKSLDFPVVDIEKLVIDDDVVDLKTETTDFNLLLSKKEPFVIKRTTLESGEGFFLCKPSGNDKVLVNENEMTAEDLKKRLKSGIWIVQKVLKSHQNIRKLNSSALNTTRIVTIRDGNKIVYLGGFQAFATGKALIDNWSEGSVYVGLNPEESCLRVWGFFHPAIPEKSITVRHPDSGIVFENYQLPWLNEAVEICLKAHQFLYNHFVIGWDVVITDDGPFILEANEKPGMNAIQCVEGGLKEKIVNAYKNIVKYYS